MVFLIRYFINLQLNLLIMSELKSKPPLSFWFISILALVWNIKGVISFIGIIFISDENLNLLSVTKKEYLTSIPVMISAVYAFSIFAGIIGSVLLLLKRNESALIFLVAFISQIVYQHYFLVIQESIKITSTNAFYPLIYVIVSFLLLVFASSNHKKEYFN